MTRDGTLTRPILATLLLVLVVDLVFVTVLAFLLTPWLSPVRALVGLPVWPAIVVPALAVLVWTQLRYTRRQTLADVGAREVTESEYPKLHARVRRLAAQAHVTEPAVAVTDSDVPNSFTVGGPREAVVVVSEGLLSALDDQQLDAVLAHELAHVKNRDAIVMTLATFLPALIDDDYSLSGDLFGSASVAFWLGVVAVLYFLAAPVVDARPFGPEYTAVFVGMVGFSVLFGSVALGVLSAPVVVLARRLSRYREFAADRAGALLCGDPTALASALRDLDRSVRVAESEAESDTPTRDSDPEWHPVGDGVRGLCLLPYGFEAPGRSDDAEPRSHPPTEQRIDRLGDLLAELERAGS
jgi:heat shock protein HtpX